MDDLCISVFEQMAKEAASTRHAQRILESKVEEIAQLQAQMRKLTHAHEELKGSSSTYQQELEGVDIALFAS